MTVQVLTGNETFQVQGQDNTGYPAATLLTTTTGALVGAALYRVAYSSASAITPAATGADNVLAAFSIPANAFNNSYRGVQIVASGLIGATANTKTMKIVYAPASATVGQTVGSGGTTIATSGATTYSGVGWQLVAQVMKYGNPNSNTQYAQEMATIVGATHGGMGVPQFSTATEGSAILIAVTGNAATATSDISLNFVDIQPTN